MWVSECAYLCLYLCVRVRVVESLWSNQRDSQISGFRVDFHLMSLLKKVSAPRPSQVLYKCINICKQPRFLNWSSQWTTRIPLYLVGYSAKANKHIINTILTKQNVPYESHIKINIISIYYCINTNLRNILRNINSPTLCVICLHVVYLRMSAEKSVTSLINSTAIWLCEIMTIIIRHVKVHPRRLS